MSDSIEGWARGFSVLTDLDGEHALVADPLRFVTVAAHVEEAERVVRDALRGAWGGLGESARVEFPDVADFVLEDDGRVRPVGLPAVVKPAPRLTIKWRRARPGRYVSERGVIWGFDGKWWFVPATGPSRRTGPYRTYRRAREAVEWQVKWGS